MKKDRWNDYMPIGLKEIELSKQKFMNALYEFNKIKQEGERIACINAEQTNKLIQKYNVKNFGNKKPSKQAFEKLAYELANGDRNIGEQYLKIAVDSTKLHQQCTETKAFEKHWFNIIHELGHIYINCRNINFYKNRTIGIIPPSIIDDLPGINAPLEIDEYHVIVWCLILLKIKGWINPLKMEAFEKQWIMPDTTYYRSWDYFSSYTEWSKGYFLHPLFRLSLLGVDLESNGYLRSDYENFDVIEAINRSQETNYCIG